MHLHMYPILSSFVCITVPLLLVVNGVFHIYVYRIVFHHNDLSMWSNHCYQESKNALIEVSVTRHDFFFSFLYLRAGNILSFRRTAVVLYSYDRGKGGGRILPRQWRIVLAQFITS
jgi:hypothetical protein